MEQEQFKQALIELGVIDPTDIEEITRKVRAIYFNNDMCFFPNPKDKVNVLLKIDYINNLIVFKHNNNGKWRTQVKPIDTIEGVDGLALTVPEGHSSGIIEKEDGTFRDLGMGEGAQAAMELDEHGKRIYKGNIYAQLNLI